MLLFSKTRKNRKIGLKGYIVAFVNNKKGVIDD